MKLEVGEKLKEKKRRKEEVKERGRISGLNLNEKQILIFLLVFLAVSALFLAVWYYIGEFYQGVIFFFAKYILLAMGYTPVQISAVDLSGAYLGNFNLVPLVALAIATPKLALRRRIEMLAIGIPILFLLHVLDVVMHFPHFIEIYYMHSPGFATMIVYSIGIVGLAIVFIIWFVICYKEFVYAQ